MFSEAWDRFKDLPYKCPHHGFSELHQIDTFYNALTQSDQDSLNAAASGNLLNRTPRDALTIIENKSKVRTSRNKPVVSKASATILSFYSRYLREIYTLMMPCSRALLLSEQRPLHHLTLKLWKKLVLLVVVHILTMSVLPPMATLSMLLQPQGPTIQDGHGYVSRRNYLIVLAIKYETPGFPQTEV
ncbi:hypothetical protein Tco_0105489 [Tanacetum coccineum]